MGRVKKKKGREGGGYMRERRERIVNYMFTKQLFISKMLKVFKSSVYKHCIYYRLKFLLAGHSERFLPIHCFLKNTFRTDQRYCLAVPIIPIVKVIFIISDTFLLSIHTWSEKAFNNSVVNRTWQSFTGGLLKKKYYVSSPIKWGKIYQLNELLLSFYIVEELKFKKRM